MKKMLAILLLGSALLAGLNLEAWRGGRHHHGRGGWGWGAAIAPAMIGAAIASSAARDVRYIDDPYEWYWSRYPRANWDAYIAWLELNRARFRRPWTYYYGPRFHRRWSARRPHFRHFGW